VVGSNVIPSDWISRQDSSLWISIGDDTVAPEGTYRYKMTFDLTGFDPASLSIAGLWAVDNAGAEIYLNGTPTGIVNNVGPSDYSPFTLDRGFIAGVNTLEFVVPNLGAGTRTKPGGADSSLHTGLRMQLSAVTVVPSNPDLAIVKHHDGTFVAGG